jgi:hypothetical protein
MSMSHRTSESLLSRDSASGFVGGRYVNRWLGILRSADCAKLFRFLISFYSSNSVISMKPHISFFHVASEVVT